jgi:hypothetical protein
MDAAPEPKPSLVSGFGHLWFSGLFGIIIALHFAKLDDTTVLFPDRSANLPYMFLAAGAFGLVSAAVGFWQSAEPSLFRRVFIPFVFWLMGTAAAFGVIYTAANLMLNARDFPPEKTRSFKLIFRISRAYRTYGTNAGWDIQIMPVRRHMYITRGDYEFMLRRRAPADHATDPDEISSGGYFCAHVTAQESGDALRIMHAGDATLPRGSVIICPKASRK